MDSGTIYNFQHCNTGSLSEKNVSHFHDIVSISRHFRDIFATLFPFQDIFTTFSRHHFHFRTFSRHFRDIISISGHFRDIISISGGSVKRVRVFMSDFGKERLAEEDVLGPQELREPGHSQDKGGEGQN
jgi:hypothetical protein